MNEKELVRKGRARGFGRTFGSDGLEMGEAVAMFLSEGCGHHDNDLYIMAVNHLSPEEL